MVTGGTLAGMDAEELISRLRRAGVTLHLWRGAVRWSGPAKFPEKFEAEFESRLDEIKVLVQRAYDRFRFKDGPHEWVLCRGDPNRVACGSPAWCSTMLTNAQLFAGRDLRRWVHLTADHLEIKRDLEGGWTAKIVGWPSGFGAPPAAKDATAMVLSICDDCVPKSRYVDGEKDEEDIRGERGR